MRKWWIKAIVQKIISLLPFKHRVNFLFQKYVTKGVELTDGLFNDKLVHCSDHLASCRINDSQNTFLELGTGWFPVIPIALHLAGASKITSVDISSLVSEERMQLTIAKFKRWLVQERLDFYLLQIDETRKQGFLNKDFSRMSLIEITQYLNIEFKIVDARELPNQGGSIDFIISNNVFEHIYAPVLQAILKEFNRVLRDDGVMSHFIDMSDHFAHMDSSITIYNYLRFSQAQWWWIDNSIQPQNRMRVTQYYDLIEEASFKVSDKILRGTNVSSEIKGNLQLYKDYNDMPKNELVISHAHLTLIKNLRTK